MLHTLCFAPIISIIFLGLLHFIDRGSGFALLLLGLGVGFTITGIIIYVRSIRAYLNSEFETRRRSLDSLEDRIDRKVRQFNEEINEELINLRLLKQSFCSTIENYEFKKSTLDNLRLRFDTIKSYGDEGFDRLDELSEQLVNLSHEISKLKAKQTRSLIRLEKFKESLIDFEGEIENLSVNDQKENQEIQATQEIHDSNDQST